MQKVTYTTSFDTTAKTITLVVSLLLAGLAGRSLAEIFRAGEDQQTLLFHAGMIAFFSAVLGLSYAFSPRRYVLTDRELVIRQLAGNKIIPLADVAEVRLVGEEELKWTIRTFGVGGLFGFYGKYYCQGLGAFTQYATRLNHRVLVRTVGGAKYILTPDDLNLVADLKARLVRAA